METESRANFSSDSRPPDRQTSGRDSTSIERMDLTASSGPITITAPDAKIMPDEDLVRAVQFGSSVAFGELFERHRKLVYLTIRRIVETTEEAEDLLQDTMVRALTSIGSFRVETRFSSWLVRIAVNAAISGHSDATLAESDRVRIRHLEQIVCELLVKNEILRTRLAVAEKQ